MEQATTYLVWEWAIRWTLIIAMGSLLPFFISKACKSAVVVSWSKRVGALSALVTILLSWPLLKDTYAWEVNGSASLISTECIPLRVKSTGVLEELQCLDGSTWSLKANALEQLKSVQEAKEPLCLTGFKNSRILVFAVSCDTP